MSGISQSIGSESRLYPEVDTRPFRIGPVPTKTPLCLQTTWACSPSMGEVPLPKTITGENSPNRQHWASGQGPRSRRSASPDIRHAHAFPGGTRFLTVATRLLC